MPPALAECAGFWLGDGGVCLGSRRFWPGGAEGKLGKFYPEKVYETVGNLVVFV